MLEFFRTHHKIGMALLLVATLGLGFFGISNFNEFFSPDSNVVAKVNGSKITRSWFDDEVRRQYEAALAQAEKTGAQFDESPYNSPQFRQGVLDNAIMQQILVDEMQRQHLVLTVSDEAVRRAEMSIPAIAALRKPDGSIDVNRYQQLLASMNPPMTPAQFDANIRSQLAGNQLNLLPNAIASSAFMTKGAQQQLMGLMMQQRNVQAMVLPVDRYAAQVQISDVQAQAYYNAHRAEFAQPATAQIQYLVLSPDTLAASTHASGDDLRSLLAKYQDTDPQNPNTFPSVVFQQSKSLQPAADKFKLTIQTASVTPQPNPALPAAHPLNNAKFLSTVFAGDSLAQHNNTQAIDVGNNTMIAARVTHYQPAGTPAFDTIKDAVRQKMVAQQARALMLQDGAAKLAELKKTKSADGFTSEQKMVQIMRFMQIPPAYAMSVKAVFGADARNLPAYIGVDMGNAYAIFRINAVGQAPANMPQLALVQQQMAQEVPQLSMLSQVHTYLEALRARAKVKLYGSVANSKQQGAGQ